MSIGDRIPCYGGDICLLPGIDSKRFLFRYQGDCLQVFCPQQADLNEPNVHKILSRGVCRFVYRRAQALLPRRFVQVSERLGISPVPLSVGRGRRKLGHCTLNGEIQLSFYFDVFARGAYRLCYLSRVGPSAIYGSWTPVSCLVQSVLRGEGTFVA